MVGYNQNWSYLPNLNEKVNKNDPHSNNYLSELSELADFVETFPNVKIALNHQIVGSHMNKLTLDGLNITPEGNMFVKR